MVKFKYILARAFGRDPFDHEGDWVGRRPDSSGFPRRLRAFDSEVIAPYDRKDLVAYMHAGWLDELTKSQISIYLLHLDQFDGHGLTEEWIAEHLEVAVSDVAADLEVLGTKAYLLHAPCEHIDNVERTGTAWVYNPEHWASDTEMLYGEFALS